MKVTKIKRRVLCAWVPLFLLGVVLSYMATLTWAGPMILTVGAAGLLTAFALAESRAKIIATSSLLLGLSALESIAYADQMLVGWLFDFDAVLVIPKASCFINVMAFLAYATVVALWRLSESEPPEPTVAR